MWINGLGFFYEGDCREGDRAATDGEISAWQAARDAATKGETKTFEQRLSALEKLPTAQAELAQAEGLPK